LPKQSLNTWTRDNLEVTYDPEADILYVKLNEGKFSHNIDLSDMVVADIGTEGELLGLEVSAVSQVMQIKEEALPNDCNIPWHLLAEVSRSMKPVLT